MHRPNVEQGLKHIGISDDDEKRQSILEAIQRCFDGKQSNLGALILMLKSWYRACSLRAWYRDSDLISFKQHAYLAGLLRRYYFHRYPSNTENGNSSQLLYSLLSNEHHLIDWNQQYYLPNFHTYRGKVEAFNTEIYQYHSVQTRLALQGDWENLVRRCEHLFSNPAKKLKSYSIDSEFYFALASGDINGMEIAIEKLLSPKISRFRTKEFEWGYEQRFFSAWGVILCKIAKRHGYTLDVESTWIPSEWIENQKCDEYPHDYNFLNTFDIYQSFKNERCSISEDISEFSPRKGKGKITYNCFIEQLKRNGAKPHPLLT